MGKQYKALKEEHIDFIREQKLFFVASCGGAEVNLSPKGYDTLRVTDSNTAVYLDYPGSGDRTARDIEAQGSVTIVFTSFTEKAGIIRLFAKGELVEKDDARFGGYIRLFDIQDTGPVRRIILYHITAVESSCGESVPFYEYLGERETLRGWAVKMHDKGKLPGYIKDHRVPPEL